MLRRGPNRRCDNCRHFERTSDRVHGEPGGVCTLRLREGMPRHLAIFGAGGLCNRHEREKEDR